MTEYEVIREIPNQCSNNQMRDVFFEEVLCESPLEYVKKQFAGKENVSYTCEELEDGNCIVYAEQAGLVQRYSFTRI